MSLFSVTKEKADRTFSAEDIKRIFTNHLTQSEQWQVGQFILKWYDLIEDEPPPMPEDLLELIEDTFEWLDDLMDLFDIEEILDIANGLPKIIRRGYNLFNRWKKVIREYQEIFK